MAKRRLSRRSVPHKKHSWVPFLDTSIFPDIISFQRVKGTYKFFLQIEIVIALLVVIGSCILVIMKFWR